MIISAESLENRLQTGCPLTVQLPASPWQREALADPLLPLVRGGSLPGATYDQAFDAIEETQPGAYCPLEAVQEYLRANWTILLAATGSLAPAESKMGRPTLLTPELFGQIEQLAESGIKDPQIYAKLGIRQQTWAYWMKDKEGDLFVAVARARATLAERLMRTIPHMEKGWQAPVWVLTQLFPDDYSRPNADTTVNVNASAISASSAVSAAISPEKIADLQARKRKQIERQVVSPAACDASSRAPGRMAGLRCPPMPVQQFDGKLRVRRCSTRGPATPLVRRCRIRHDTSIARSR